MISAKEMRRATKVDTERVEALVNNVYTMMLDAAEKGQNHCDAWMYDPFANRWLGGVPDSVIEEAERRFTEAGYEIEWSGRSGYAVRVIKW